MCAIFLVHLEIKRSYREDYGLLDYVDWGLETCLKNNSTNQERLTRSEAP
jgi:hypothetical protein